MGKSLINFAKKKHMLKFLKKHWSNILILALIALLIVPQTRLPIQIFVNRVISFDPSVLEDDQTITDYQWRLQTLAGETVNFSESKKEVILINFWATWCAPCIAEMPDFQALYKDYGQQVDFYFVTSDSKSSIKKFMRENTYAFPVYFAMEKEPNVLIGQQLPTTFLIDKKGNIVIKEFGTADWNSEAMRKILDGLLEKPVASMNNTVHK